MQRTNIDIASAKHALVMGLLLTFARPTAWIETKSGVADARETADRVTTCHIRLSRTPGDE